MLLWSSEAPDNDAIARETLSSVYRTLYKVRFGPRVELEDAESGERVTYTLLGEEEADVSSPGRVASRCVGHRSTISLTFTVFCS